MRRAATIRQRQIRERIAKGWFISRDLSSRLDTRWRIAKELVDKGRYTRSRYHRDNEGRYDSYQSVIRRGGGRNENSGESDEQSFPDFRKTLYFLSFQSRDPKINQPLFLFLPSKCHRFFQANGSTTLLSAKCITFRGRFNAEFLSKCKVLTG